MVSGVMQATYIYMHIFLLGIYQEVEVQEYKHASVCFTAKTPSPSSTALQTCTLVSMHGFS